MRIGILACCLLLLGGCREDAVLPDGFCDRIDMKGPSNADLTTTPPVLCAAAKGLPGENLACIDFGPIGSLTDPRLSKWTFSCLGTASWTTMGGALQVNSFTTYMDTCFAKMPALSMIDYQKYNSFTLSVIHAVDLNKQKQSSAIYLSADQDTQQLWLSTGMNPKQTTTITVIKSLLPNSNNNLYQPLFKITSGVQAGTANQGWQIESIAINASL